MIELKKRNETDLSHLVMTQTFVVRQGAFKVLSQQRDVIQIIGPGEFFGPEILFCDTKFILGGKSLMPELTLCALPHADFEKLMDSRPELNRLTLTTLARRSLVSRVAFHWARKSLRERAILVLHYLRERFGVRYGQFRMIDIPLTKIDLASLMSTVQESAVRVLSELREDGLISSNGKRVVILDNERLDRMREEILRPSDDDEEPAAGSREPARNQASDDH